VIRSTANNSVPENRDAEHIDAIINELGKFNPNYALALRCHYYDQHRKFKDKVASSPLCQRTYARYLSEGKLYVAKKLC